MVDAYLGRYAIGSTGEVIIGRSPVMQRLFETIDGLAKFAPVPILITGETGAGKELVAKALHYNNPTINSRPFIAVNCAGIPDTLLETELFGHVKGAYTGANGDRRGKVLEAEGGTLFLDEIGDMPPALQAKILRLTQYREITPVGADRSRKVDVRIITATNRDLEALVPEGRFREDLLHRLSTFPIHVPALREHLEDIPALADHLLEVYNERFTITYQDFEPGCYEKLQTHPWPGNVRELENTIQRAMFLGNRERIQADLLFLGLKAARAAVANGGAPHPVE